MKIAQTLNYDKSAQISHFGFMFRMDLNYLLNRLLGIYIGRGYSRRHADNRLFSWF